MGVYMLKTACDGQGDELSLKYKRVSMEDAEQGWNEVFEASLDSCMHGMYCQQGADCQVSNLFSGSKKICQVSSMHTTTSLILHASHEWTTFLCMLGALETDGLITAGSKHTD